MAARSRLFRLDDFLERIFQFDSFVSSHAGLQPEHRSESDRAGLAPGVDVLYASESGDDIRPVCHVTTCLLCNSAAGERCPGRESQESAARETANSAEEKGPRTLARKLEEAWILNLILVIAGIAALGLVWH